ncbi:hypothetical protein [Paenibacillus sp. N3.4]|uniref:hypothetical protein n=1 Tax=Paenibacillus sp. N3.4 TaxID=2603222 RepID=UPI001650155B|nr:hypothetical protein [Paenibacillus sp. N3.4]
MNEIIEKNCSTAVEYAVSFGHTLDFTDASIKKVEEILDYYANELSTSSADDKPTENQVWSMAIIWGSYLGETMVRNIGEPCKWIYEEGEYLLEAKEAIANPVGKTYKRLINGKEDNVYSFYDIISLEIKKHINAN